MSSTYTVFPSQFLDGVRPDRMHDQRAVSTAVAPRDHQQNHLHTQHGRPSTPTADAVDRSHLSPFSNQLERTSSTSPINNSFTSAESTPSSAQYQSSDYSELDDDPFFGLDFNVTGGTPSFLGGTNGGVFPDGFAGLGDLENQQYNHVNGPGYLISPEQTPSLRTVSVSPQSEKQGTSGVFATAPYAYEADSHEELPRATKRAAPEPHYTPNTSSTSITSIPSSDDGVAPTIPAMSAQSPRVTVSLWGKDGDDMHNIGSAFHLDPTGSMGGNPADSSFVAPPPPPPAPAHQRSVSDSGLAASRDTLGRWIPDTSTGQRGLDPTSRPQGETSSANELATGRATQERNQEVDQWLTSSAHASARSSVDNDNRPRPQIEGVSDREIGLGGETTNVMKPGRTYYTGTGGELTDEDRAIMGQNQFWNDAPAVLSITDPRQPSQPETSNAAIHKFDAMCRDNDSIVSRAATWGTRRRSLPSILDIEGITSGNFLKKLSISRGEPRKPNVFFKELRTLVRKPSATGLANLKRSFSSQDDDLGLDPAAAGERRESRDSLAPPSRAMSWGKRPTPSINTALVGMGSNIAAIGTTHARSGSISTTTPVASPKSPFSSLKVANPLVRRRSKSDLPKLGTDNSLSNIADMWKRTGGPPIGALAKPAGAAGVFERDDDDDDDDDDLDDADMKMESTKMIADITPNFAGFQQHILRLNPALADKQRSYLVDRIAHQQIIRYKSLLNARVKHLGHIRDRNCHCGTMCIALGGSAVILDSRGGSSAVERLDPLSARLDSSDGDITPLEGAIAPESFPQDIPMPPTQTLPAEFECQLCFQAKKFQKPSDWTKHVHEDVQPFTCTWDRCRDPKIFKRKADWVRHENEGHRHLEWWTCDVEDCRHTCYRRDNFLQHLVREHKFTEPKVKTKAAIKRAGALDPTWQKVEKCHAETQARPQDEPCRFCGKAFPTWKKLTVHLAKHMEQISLPILRLVAQKDLDPDTIISPVQEPPQRPFVPLPPPQLKQEPMHHQHQQPPFGQSPIGPRGHSPGGHPMQQQQHYVPPQAAFGFAVPSPGGLGASFPAFHHPQPHAHQVQAQAQAQAQIHQQPRQPHYDAGLATMQNLDTTVMDWPQVNTAMAAQQNFGMGMPVTTAGPASSFVAGPQQSYMLPVSASGMEPFPQLPITTGPMTTMGLHDPSVGLHYDPLMDPSVATGAGMVPPHSGSMAGGAHFVPQGSGSSPYDRSPHQQPGSFF